jgi:hypothetical protein
MIILRQKIFFNYAAFAKQYGRRAARKMMRSRNAQAANLKAVRNISAQTTQKANKIISGMQDPAIQAKARQSLSQSRANMYNTAQTAANSAVQSTNNKIVTNFNKSQAKKLQMVENLGRNANKEVAGFMGVKPKPNIKPQPKPKSSVPPVVQNTPKPQAAPTPTVNTTPAPTTQSTSGGQSQQGNWWSRMGTGGKVAVGGAAALGTVGGGIYLKNKIDKNKKQKEENQAAMAI